MNEYPTMPKSSVLRNPNGWILPQDVLIYTRGQAQDDRLHLLITTANKLGARWPLMLGYQGRWWSWYSNESPILPDVDQTFYGHGSYNLVPAEAFIDADPDVTVYLDDYHGKV